jgi:glycosyltransferase involved in cell wall biosynthesis
MPDTSISVITAALNSSQHIAQTLDSVASQVGVDCEHIVADGGSIDGTQAIIESRLRSGGRWISGSDSGIADAMNKGLALARGEWLLFLQSDDYLLAPDVLAKAGTHLTDQVDICGFPVRYGSDLDSVLLPPRGNGFWLNFKTGFNHQGTFIRRSLFERLGAYDTSLRIAMDYEFFLRARRASARMQCFDSPVVALMRDTGISGQRDWSSLEERVHRKHQTGVLQPLYAIWWALYPRYRSLLATR